MPLHSSRGWLAATLAFPSGDFQLAVALSVNLDLSACKHLPRGHPRASNELLEIASNELRAIVGDDSRLRFRVLLVGSQQDHFDIRFSHRLTQIPMHEETTEPNQNAAQVIERASLRQDKRASPRRINQPSLTSTPRTSPRLPRPRYWRCGWRPVPHFS